MIRIASRAPVVLALAGLLGSCSFGSSSDSTPYEFPAPSDAGDSACAPTNAALGRFVFEGQGVPDYSGFGDHRMTCSARGSLGIRARNRTPKGFATWVARTSPLGFGNRVRLGGYVRAQDVTGWAGLWMRVDGPDGTVLAFDNMQNRPIVGDQPFQRAEVVLDLPPGAEQISFGMLLAGDGVVWLDGVSLEAVGPDVSTTRSVAQGL
jgi:hypothetical protein